MQSHHTAWQKKCLISTIATVNTLVLQITGDILVRDMWGLSDWCKYLTEQYGEDAHQQNEDTEHNHETSQA